MADALILIGVVACLLIGGYLVVASRARDLVGWGFIAVGIVLGLATGVFDRLT